MRALPIINNSYESFQALIDLYQENKNKHFSEISLEIRNFFAANMSSVLGAILDRFTDNVNSIRFIFSKKDVKTVLSKNDFLTYYGLQRALDVNNTTIKYQKLKKTDGKYFKQYVVEEFIEGHNTDLPRMSKGVKEKIVEAIYEIFVNAQIHSETDYIYTCGQFFPNKHKIEFTIVDMGIGFKRKIKKRFGRNISSIDAISWAVKDRMTTKDIPGGIGLALLREFIDKNSGKMQIVSGDGFYQYEAKEEKKMLFRGSFPGTIVNLQFKTDDSSSYSLGNEINMDEIF